MSHCTSAHSPPRQATLSHSVERCWSGGICRRTTRGPSRSIDDALDRGDHVVAGQRVLPRLQRRVPHLGFHQVHLADAALILLEGGDLLGIGRPQHDGPVAAGPAGVVGGVAEVLDAVGGERRLLAGGGVAHPQIRIANEGGVLLVGGENLGSGAAAAASAPAPSAAPAAHSPRLLPRSTSRPSRRTSSARPPAPKSIARRPRTRSPGTGGCPRRMRGRWRWRARRQASRGRRPARACLWRDPPGRIRRPPPW